MSRRVVLASGSPQRREILAKLGVEFEVVVPGVEELCDGDPVELVVENARRKARAVTAGADALVIACDTDVVLDGVVLGKPADAAEARAYLERMSGRPHEVLSGLVVRDGAEERSGLERTTVVFKRLSEAEKERYVAFGEWQGRSGGYAIQTLGSTLVERLVGSVSNVVGLPVGLLAELAPTLFE
ncbi:MAG: nucleoside triphosphate pyrophosphatase [Solirubrobacterales bacterium]|jgi:septum formation protein|nr:nucleoside triphosphate pyrophosphatase [Solirubrobacterales bacterium]